MSIIQRIEIREDGSARAEAAIDGVNDALNEQGRAGARAGAGLDRAGRAAQESGRSVQGAGGWWANFKKTIGETTSGIGSLQFATQGLGFIMGAVSGGTLAAFLGTIGDIIAAVNGPEGLTEGFRVLDTSAVEAKTGIEDLSSQMDAFAKNVGVANEKLLTFEQRQTALREIANEGGAMTFDALGQRAEDIAKRLEKARALNAIIPGAQADLEAQLADELARVQGAQSAIQWRAKYDAASEAATKRQDAAIAQAQADARRNRAGGRGSPRPVGGTFFGAGAFGASILAGAQEGAAFGPADDPFARKLAAFEAPETDKLGNIIKPFQAAEAAALAFAEARDKAFQYESAGQFFDVVNASVDSFGQATAASAANAILFGSSFAKGVNTAMKALAAQAAAQALWEGAQAIGALALGRPDAAALHWEAAALYTGVAAAAVLGAAASGGLRSGGGRRGGGGSGAAGGVSEVGGNGGGPTVFAPTIIVGLDGEPIYRRMHQINDDREGSQSQRRFVAA